MLQQEGKWLGISENPSREDTSKAGIQQYLARRARGYQHEVMTPGTPKTRSWLMQEIVTLFGLDRDPEKPAKPHAERRTEKRKSSDFAAEVSIGSKAMTARGLNIHGTGLGVLCATPLATGSVVFVRVRPQGLMGFAHVRYCQPRGSGYAVGLEYRGEPMRDEPGRWNIQHISSQD